MSKRKKDQRPFWLKLASILLALLSLIGLSGAMGFFLGKPVYNFMTSIFGKGMALVGFALCLIAAFFFWIYSGTLMADESVKFSASILKETSEKRRKSSRSRRPNQQKKIELSQKIEQPPKVKLNQTTYTQGISLPAGKLVTLKGFNKYFSSPEWADVKDEDCQIAAEMEELGTDFPSYFGRGKSTFSKARHKLGVLHGLRNYFEEVDHDEEERQKRVNPNRDGFSGQEILKPVKALEKPLFSPIFESQKDQDEFLAQYKNDRIPRDHEVKDLKLATSQIVTEELIEVERMLDVEEKSEIEEISETIEIQAPASEISEEKSSVLTENPKCSPEKSMLETRFESSIDSVAVLAAKDKSLNKVLNYAGQVEPLVKLAVKRDGHWKLPDFTLLDPLPLPNNIQDPEMSQQLEKVLMDFGVKAKVIRVTKGPVITRYELAPAPGVKISKIVNLSDDIALGLAAQDVRIEAPIPGKAAIGIEVPNKQARSVPFREVLETTQFRQYPSKLKVALGKDIADQAIVGDLVKMPHLLVAGATGSGKSVCITTIINSILYNAAPNEVKFLLVDPKVVELSQYNGIPHLLAPVVVDPKKAASALKWIVKEMENRYDLFAAAGVRDIERYNKLKTEEINRKTPALSFIVVIIDELADLMVVAAGEVEEAICRLAQMARAAGIHLVIATQRPSVDVITGVIKANIPSRISFAVSSQIDSRTILDANGAEKLLGRGDMLYSPLGQNKPRRVQGCLVTDEEVQRVIKYWKDQGKPEYLDPEMFTETTVKGEESGGPDDALFIEAGHLFIKTGMASVSFLQRRLKLGYNRAARLMDMLEEEGVVGAYEGSKPRQVLLTLEEFQERFE